MKQLLGFSLFLLSIISAAQIHSPRYDNSECPVFIRRLAEDSGADISCGYLTVPEDRQALETGRIAERFVARIAARQPIGHTPVMHLSGGPGMPVAEDIASILQSQLHQHYDFIAIDQRGAGYSRPSLNCHGLDDQTDYLNPAWSQPCYRRLVNDGIALRAYDSASDAHDLHDLLVALEIDQANVYGYSYGTRLALTLARDFPQRIRALMLDGVLPLQVNLLEALAPNGNQSIARIFSSCAADADCRRAYPDLSASFGDVLAALNRSPAEVQTEEYDHPIAVTAQDFVFNLLYSLYEKHLIPFLPAKIDAYAHGEYDFEMARGEGELPRNEPDVLGTPDGSSEGTLLSYLCAEEAPFNRRERIANRAANLTGVLRRALVDWAVSYLNDCNIWEAPRSSARENQPVKSDIPTLLLSGYFDPATPPEWGDEAAEHLTNSWHYVFPDAGHGVLFEADAACALTIALSFLEDPLSQPADACLESMTGPDFYIRP